MQSKQFNTIVKSVAKFTQYFEHVFTPYHHIQFAGWLTRCQIESPWGEDSWYMDDYEGAYVYHAYRHLLSGVWNKYEDGSDYDEVWDALYLYWAQTHNGDCLYFTLKGLPQPDRTVWVQMGDETVPF